MHVGRFFHPSHYNPIQIPRLETTSPDTPTNEFLRRHFRLVFVPFQLFLHSRKFLTVINNYIRSVAPPGGVKLLARACSKAAALPGY